MRPLMIAGLAVALATAGCAGSKPPRAASRPEPASKRVCAPRDALAKALTSQLGETRVAAGLARSGKQLMEIFARPDGASWTMIVTKANGVACVVTVGQAWQSAAPAGTPAQES